MRLSTIRGASARGPWTYVSGRPPALEGLVDHLWAFRGPTADRFKRIFPNGCIELILNFAEPYTMGEGRAKLPRAWISGPVDGPLVIEQPAYQECIAARLRPAGARALFARPMDEVAGRNVELPDLVGRSANELWERSAEVGIEHRLELLAHWLSARFATQRPLNDALAWIVRELDQRRGVAPIADLQHEVGFSKKRLVSSFRDRVGLTPKVYARVVRFHHALRTLQHAPSVRLTELAFDSGFYDQPHMNAEFRALGGITPSEFLAARHPVGDGSTAAHRTGT